MRGNIRQRDYISDKLSPNEVIVDLYVLSPLMVNGALCNADGTGVVCIEWSGAQQKCTKFSKLSMKPHNFSTG